MVFYEDYSSNYAARRKNVDEGVHNKAVITLWILVMDSGGNIKAWCREHFERESAGLEINLI